MEQFQNGIPLTIKPKTIDDFPAVLKNILDEAKHRRLEPGEVLQILNDHEKLEASDLPLSQPSAGSVCLYNAKLSKKYRDDGHTWNKKAEGPLSRVTLKVGGETLEYFVSHLKGDEEFRRRTYAKKRGVVNFAHYLRDIEHGSEHGSADDAHAQGSEQTAAHAQGSEQTALGDLILSSPMSTPVEDIGSSSINQTGIVDASLIGFGDDTHLTIPDDIFKFAALGLPRLDNPISDKVPFIKRKGAKLVKIRDFAPDSAYTDTPITLLIAVNLLPTAKSNKSRIWGVKVNKKLYEAECTGDVIKCHFPASTFKPGTVRFCVVAKDGKELSETMGIVLNQNPEEENNLIMKLLRSIHCAGVKWKPYLCVESNCGECEVKGSFLPLLSGKSNSSKHEDFIRDRLYELLVSRVHQTYEFLHEFDDTGMSIVHHLMGLGYSWAVNPLKAAGIDLTREDGNKKSPVDYAEKYGRSETVAMLRDETVLAFSSLMKTVAGQP